MDATDPELIDMLSNERVSVNTDPFSIGRGNNNSLIIEDLQISRTHCVLEKANDKWTIRDKSSNGTSVNDKQIQSDQQIDLSNGDVIVLSMNSKFTFSDKASEIVDLTDTDKPLLDFSLDEAANWTEADMLVNDDAGTSKVEVIDFTSKYGGDDKSAVASKEAEGIDMNSVESEFTCSICTELFIKAVTLNCSHTFCNYCIDQWRKKQKVCPICRAKIQTASSTIVVDNYIEKVLESASDETKQKRKEVVTQRLEEAKASAVPSGTKTAKGSTHPIFEPIDISSEELTNSDSDWDEFLASDDYEDSYTGIRGVYYGGYGRCYSCGERGHWANGCPNSYR